MANAEGELAEAVPHTVGVFLAVPLAASVFLASPWTVSVFQIVSFEGWLSTDLTASIETDASLLGALPIHWEGITPVGDHETMMSFCFLGGGGGVFGVFGPRKRG